MKRVLPLAIFLLPGAAFAHSGAHGTSLLSGLTHPISGADHILAMVAVGLWAGLTGGRALWLLPITFVTAMLVGGVLAAAGVPFPAVEPVILASIMVLGVASAMALKPGLISSVVAVTPFGLAHGFAHGAEGPASNITLFVLGFTASTAALHLTGASLARSPTIARALGAATAIAGIALAFN